MTSFDQLSYTTHTNDASDINDPSNMQCTSHLWPTMTGKSNFFITFIHSLCGPEFFFTPYFPYCISSVHHCEHRFHICFFVRSSHTWFSYIYSHSSFLFYWLTFCLCRLRDEKMKFHINLEVQLLLKQGQVSVLQSHQTNPVLIGSSPSLCCNLGGGYTRLLYHRLYRQCSDSSLGCRGP